MWGKICSAVTRLIVTDREWGCNNDPPLWTADQKTSVEWLHTTSSLRVPLQHGHCFGDAGGVSLVHIMPGGQSINSDLHIQIRKPFQKRFRKVIFHKNVAAVRPEHDNARPHTRSALVRDITQRLILFISRLKPESKQNTQEAVTKPS